MAKARNVYPGGNTCYGFYSFYDHIVPFDAARKIILKGGPGTGKSTFMKAIAADFGRSGYDLEYHWCSSDNDSLDGVVIGDADVCLLDGTAPHVVDPRYPGAVDHIINLGDFWDAEAIIPNKQKIIDLSQQIGLQFERAYNRLQEANCAWREWASWIEGAIIPAAVKRNILALTDDFIHSAPQSDHPLRHLFAGALTPGGVVTKVETLIDSTWSVFAIKGSPASGAKDLLKHIEKIIAMHSIYAEIFHSPFDPANLDMILVPANKTAIIDISGNIVDYENNLGSRNYKRLLDFDQLLDPARISPCAEVIAAASGRLQASLEGALKFIQAAKHLHDELEEYYVPAMDFSSMEDYRHELYGSILQKLKNGSA